MLAKKFVLLAGTTAALTAASAAFATGYYDPHGKYHPYNNSYSERVVVQSYPSYYYDYAPAAPTYYPAPAYYGPAPSYSYYEAAPPYYGPAPQSYYYAPNNAAAGAVAGALIGGAIADRHHRGEAAVAGALLGGVIGNQYDRYSY